MATPGFIFKLISPNANTSEGNAVIDGTPGDVVQYEVTLATQPGNTGGTTSGGFRQVKINFTSSDTTEGTVTPSLTFDNTNWNIPQILTISGQDDLLYDANNVSDGDVSYSISAVIDQAVTNALEYKTISIPTVASLLNLDDPEDAPIIKSPYNTGTDDVDYMTGSNGNDVLYGRYGYDEIKGGYGNDRLYGEQDNDYLFGGQGNDTAYGADGDDWIEGNEGDDKLYGGYDNDVLIGNEGNDYLNGEFGFDTMSGGAGNDTYAVDELTDVIDDKGLASDVDTVLVGILGSASYSYTLAKNIENGTLQGDSDSNMTGNTSNNVLTGNTGDNSLNGGDGSDKLLAGEGADALNGGKGNDAIDGGTGNDALNGGVGSDKLTGGTGRDIFFFNASLTGSVDTITDFKPVDDTIKIENSIFTSLTVTGTVSANQFVVGDVSQDANDYLLYNKSTGALMYDADGNGDGAPVQVATLGVNLSLTNADFVVI